MCQLVKFYLYFQIIAREMDTSEALSSSAVVTVSIIDMNDNVPMFEPDFYPPTNVSEDAAVGTEVLQITVNDPISVSRFEII